MAAYSSERFVQEFANRTCENLRAISEKRRVVYEDTALISSLLAVFVLPHERADDPMFMEDLLLKYREHALEEIVEVRRIKPQRATSSDTADVPKSIGEIPRFLRHAVAHMNIRPQSEDGQSLTHLLVWNTNPYSKKITFVASVHVGRLRGLALHVLDQLSKSKLGDKYDGIDPITKFDADHPELAGCRD